MRLLLDTHVFLWAAGASSMLSPAWLSKDIANTSLMMSRS